MGADQDVVLKVQDEELDLSAGVKADGVAEFEDTCGDLAEDG